MSQTQYQQPSCTSVLCRYKSLSTIAAGSLCIALKLTGVGTVLVAAGGGMAAYSLGKKTHLKKE